MTNTTINITEESKNLFIAFAEDSGNWDGMPVLGGNVDVSKEQRGNLTQLKKEGLITTEYEPEERLTWLTFTEDGERYANELGINLGAADRYKINGEHFAK